MAGSSLASGIIGGAASRVAGNVMDDDPILIALYHPQTGQRVFRQAIMAFLDTHLEPIIKDIMRNNRRAPERQVLNLELTGDLAILTASVTEESRLFIELRFEVIPNDDAQPRPLEQGIPPPELPQHHQGVREAYILPRRAPGVLDGAAKSGGNGLLLGAIAACLAPISPAFQAWYFVRTVPGLNMGAFVGLPTLSGFGAAAAEVVNPASPSATMVSWVDFAAEFGLHINRVIECAARNGVGLHYYVAAGYRQRIGAEHHQPVNILPGVNAGNTTGLWYLRQFPDG
ncbi:hypothetical protein ASPCAL03189 [Aspergillus calidoustus]|uniref:Uncharacterized protein n=1 Tax=Aspergillus calidoustus TaxID=454130 RepID=A0A0U5CP00_ASPCI|nr:hypothetical protein ASPCAL03189 [Aspergillus calidoustus]